MKQTEFQTHFQEYLKNIEEAKQKKAHHDQLRNIFVGFLDKAFGVKCVEVELEKGIPTEIVDVSCMSEEQIQNAYTEAIPLAISKKFRMRRVFGTKHQSVSRFGKEVPALFVYGDEQGKLIDFYPRIEEQDHIVTILNFFTQAKLGL